jgi:hypothetical protein
MEREEEGVYYKYKWKFILNHSSKYKNKEIGMNPQRPFL